MGEARRFLPEASVALACGLSCFVLVGRAGAQTAPPAGQPPVPEAAPQTAPGGGSETTSATSERSSAEEGEASEASAAPDGEEAAPADDAAQEAESEAGEDDLELEAERKAEPPPAEAKPAPAKKARHPEDESDLIEWPFGSDKKETGKAHRLASGGPFVGWISRPSKSDSIRYKPGIAYGGYLRPEITSWLGLRIAYREESIPVEVEPGAYDYEGETFDFDFTQPDLEIVHLGVRLEPTWVIHPNFRLRGILGWAWLGMRAPAPKADGFEIKRTYRTAVQTEISVGAGLAVDIIRDWLDVSVDFAYSMPNSRTGDAYEDQQVIVDGEIAHIGPLPKLHSASEVIFSVGLIL